MKEPEKNGAGVFLVLGSGATVGSGAKVHIRGQEFLPPLDRDFWKTPVVQSILGREKYPALWHYRERISTDSLERTWAEIDLILKLCIKGIISEEEQFGTLQGAMRATGIGTISTGTRWTPNLRPRECHLLPLGNSWAWYAKCSVTLPSRQATLPSTYSSIQ